MTSNARYPSFGMREYPKYVPHNTLGLTLYSAGVSAGAGVFAAALKNSLLPHKGAKFFHPRTGYIVSLFTVAGSAYTLTESISANLREKEDGWNNFYGGAAAGAIIGSTFASIPKVVGFAFFVGGAIGFYNWTGGVDGWGRDKAIELTGEIKQLEKGQKQGFWDVVHRRPLSQTVEELGDLVKPFK